jgi:S-DNA-T family DNA segregation ATPase FtsK/SpoIIIE
MASKKKHPHLRREIVGIILTGFGVFILCCLITYHPDDPSFSLGYSSIPKEIHNLGGLIGSYISDALFRVFGLVAYIIPVSLFLIAGKILFLPTPLSPIFYMRSVLVVIFLLCLQALLSLSIKELNIFRYQFDAGGLLGQVLAKILVTYLNLFGAYLALILIMLLTLTGVTRISYINLWRYFTKILLSICQKAYYELLSKIKKINIHWSFERKKKKAVKISRTSNKKEYPVIREEVLIKERQKEVENHEEFIAPAPSKAPVHFTLPPLSLLDSPPEKEDILNKQSLREMAEVLIQKLEDFGIKGKVIEISPGPVITRFEFEPAPGVKINKIVSLSDDLSLALKAISVRIVAPIPEKSVIGIEIPNKKRELVFFKEIVGREEFLNAPSKLTLGIGKKIAGNPVINDLARMPHLLIAGATGSGKSVLINAMICSILYKATPDDVKFLMIDPKRLELSHYEGISHLLHPVVIDPKKAAIALHWAVDEMERRYKKLAEKGVRDIVRYNQKIQEEKENLSTQTDNTSTLPEGEEQPEQDTKMPYIVVVIDELADLMMVSARDVEVHIARLAQMARASGIHLLVATQRPSVDVLTGTIKVNFPCRISFQVTSKVDSRTILDTIGAERLLGMGDMLFLPPGTSKLQRIHGAYLSEEEITKIVQFLKAQGSPFYDESILTAKTDDVVSSEDDYDELYDQAVALVADTRQASISMVQRRLRVGYNRAARMIEKMEQEGVVGPSDGIKPRDVLVNKL